AGGTRVELRVGLPAGNVALAAFGAALLLGLIAWTILPGAVGAASCLLDRGANVGVLGMAVGIPSAFYAMQRWLAHDHGSWLGRFLADALDVEEQVVASP